MRKFFRTLTVLLLCSLFLSFPASAAFPDVPADSWYGPAVTQMAAKGLLSGGPDGRFRPNDPISAAEWISIVARAAALPTRQGQAPHWASGWTQAALEAGWYDWDELPPTGERFDEPIPRQLAVKILMRALLPDARGDYLTESQKIRDFSQLDGRYYESTLAAYAAGIVSGDAAGRFRPAGSLSRAEASLLAAAALEKAQGVPVQTAAQPTAGNIQPSAERVQAPAEDAQTSGSGTAEVPRPAITHSGGVSENGWLQVRGTQLCSESGEPVVLRGMSTHGLQWYSQYANAQSLRNLSAFGANLFRVAVYTE